MKLCSSFAFLSFLCISFLQRSSVVTLIPFILMYLRRKWKITQSNQENATGCSDMGRSKMNLCTMFIGFTILIVLSPDLDAFGYLRKSILIVIQAAISIIGSLSHANKPVAWTGFFCVDRLSYELYNKKATLNKKVFSDDNRYMVFCKLRLIITKNELTKFYGFDIGMVFRFAFE